MTADIIILVILGAVAVLVSRLARGRTLTRHVCPICSEPFDETDPGTFVSNWDGQSVLRCPKCYKREHHE